MLTPSLSNIYDNGTSDSDSDEIVEDSDHDDVVEHDFDDKIDYCDGRPDECGSIKNVVVVIPTFKSKF